MILAFVPIGATVVFFALYWWAARVYPGGTVHDPGTRGFSFWHNYWCDLTESRTYAGGPNPSAFPARVGLFVALFGIAVFLYNLGVRFEPWPVRATVQTLGPATAAAVCLIFTRYHNQVVYLAFPPATAVLVLALWGQWQSAMFLEWALCVVALGLVVANFLVWLRGFASYLPALQKVAFGAFFLWLISTSAKLFWFARNAL